MFFSSRKIQFFFKEIPENFSPKLRFFLHLRTKIVSKQMQQFALQKKKSKFYLRIFLFFLVFFPFEKTKNALQKISFFLTETENPQKFLEQIFEQNLRPLRRENFDPKRSKKWLPRKFGLFRGQDFFLQRKIQFSWKIFPKNFDFCVTKIVGGNNNNFPLGKRKISRQNQYFAFFFLWKNEKMPLKNRFFLAPRPENPQIFSHKFTTP